METAVFGAVCNVKINLNDITDEGYCQEMGEKADREMAIAQDNYAKVISALEDRASTK